jgi:hypothetical protein
MPTRQRCAAATRAAGRVKSPGLLPDARKESTLMNTLLRI